MARVTCVDCGGEVVVDPTGRCPEGHMLGAAGARIEHAIGADTPHPEEPEPWVATITAEEVERPAAGSVSETDEPARVARPVQAPGPPANATNGAVDTDALFGELHTLAQSPGEPSPPQSDNGSGPATPAPATPDREDGAELGGPATPAPATPDRDDDAAELSDLASLEAMLQELSEPSTAPATAAGPADPTDATPPATAAGPTDATPPASPTDPTPVPDQTGDTATDQAAAAEATGVELPPAPPAHARSETPPPPPPPPGPDDATQSPPTDAGPLDLSNFTAKGRKVSGKGRRLRR